jgi:adenine-specific DNA-methyltransferase
MHIQSFDEFLQSPPSVQATEFANMVAELERFRNQKYGLVFNENVHQEAIVTQCRMERPVLVVPPENNDLPHLIEHIATQNDLMDAAELPTHLLIEGDNYPALSALTDTHTAAVDMIYIDPPYNTGTRDFRYNDNFTDKEDSTQHTKWLCFMKRRLALARVLLKESGLIFISIDDNEQAQLKLLCDEIFGERNFVQDLIWHNKYTLSNDAKFFSKQHDYILCYAKNVQQAHINLLEKTPEAKARYRNPDNDARGDWKATPLDARSGSAANIFALTFPNGIVWQPTEGRFSVYSKEKLLQLYADNRLWFGKNGTAKPSKKTFATEAAQGMKCGSILSFDLFGHTHKANDELADILGKGKFSSPKPTDLIKKLIELSIPPNKSTPSVILDFFAGSGTTGHAVLALNRADSGNRQFILVTNNEVTDKIRKQLTAEGKTEAAIEAHGIARSVTYLRLRKVIEGYTNAKGIQIAGTGGTMRYFQVGFVARTDKD